MQRHAADRRYGITVTQHYPASGQAAEAYDPAMSGRLELGEDSVGIDRDGEASSYGDFLSTRSMYGERESGFSLPNSVLGKSTLDSANAYSRDIQRTRDERKAREAADHEARTFVDPKDITDYSIPTDDDYDSGYDEMDDQHDSHPEVAATATSAGGDRDEVEVSFPAFIDAAGKKWVPGFIPGEYVQVLSEKELSETSGGLEDVTDIVAGIYGAAKQGFRYVMHKMAGAALRKKLEDKSWMSSKPKLSAKQNEQIGGVKLEGLNPGNVTTKKGKVFVDTELPGGIKAARDLFEKLTGRGAPKVIPKEGHSEVLKSGQQIRIRDTSKSGYPKIEVTDPNQSILEKITFK